MRRASLRQGQQEVHVMLDDNNGMMLRDFLQHDRGLRCLRVGHAGHGLIKQNQFRVLREQHADLQPLFLAVR